MRVVVEVISGPGPGRKTVLGAGQMLRIGRTEWADIAFPQDNRMSGEHFLLETDQNACYVTDLGSTNGTFINKRRIAERTVLRNQDELLAGQTVFIIRVEGDNPPQPAQRTASVHFPASAALPEVNATQTIAGRIQVNYTVERCESGLRLCRGTVAEITPADLAVKLCRLLPVYLIVDFNHLGSPPPEDLSTPNYLFDWLAPIAAAGVSPVIVAQDDMLTWPTLVEQGWGNDAVVCLFSKQEKPALLDHLHQSCRTKSHAFDPNASIMGFCWPSVLAPLLSYYTPSYVQQLLAGIDAVLVEMPDLPETWQIFGNAQIVDLMDKLGFNLRSSNRAASPN
jgi:hypothetical protein